MNGLHKGSAITVFLCSSEKKNLDKFIRDYENKACLMLLSLYIYITFVQKLLSLNTERRE